MNRWTLHVEGKDKEKKSSSIFYSFSGELHFENLLCNKVENFCENSSEKFNEQRRIVVWVK